MDELYIEVLSEPSGGFVTVTLESLITLVTLKYCKDAHNHLVFVLREEKKPAFTVKISSFKFDLVRDNDIKDIARICQLPIIVSGNNCIVAGLCAILRQVLKNTSLHAFGHGRHPLLGFRQGCLVACAESSVWTRFCEVDVISSVKDLMLEDFLPNILTLPTDIARFEIHMSQPLRIHNIQKVNQEFLNSKIANNCKLKKNISQFSCEEGRCIELNQNSSIGIEHTFAEGPLMTLADVILLPCFHIMLQIIRSVYLQPYIPLTIQWFENMKNDPDIEETLGIISDIPKKIIDDLYVKYIFPDIPKQSLYKSDPKRYKPRNRIFTKQEDVEVSLKLVEEMGINIDWQLYPFGCELQFDWGAIPFEAHPEGGHLPALRIERKGQQLENLAKAVLKIAKPGQTIIDFCSGSGHLGIVLAYLLPRCEVVLLENKEESLGRARQRVIKLKLTNVTFCQCNLDYFCGEFDIGVSLHACGVATDLVIQRCIAQNAVFVCCPCCYGSVQNNHILTYPRSRVFQESAMSLREYLVLGHSADQTHDEFNVKTDQGKVCMGIIDTDRCIQARESGYTVSLSKLIPETCTPKNNLLVGIPQNWEKT